MRPPAAAALLLLASLPVRAEELARISSDLEGGGWNVRVHAVHALEAHEDKGLPLLERAADDADWQVRMTAIHYMGRLGEPAIPALSSALEREPCRHVRLTALHWLGRMGAPAEEALKRALDDESRLVRVNNRYWLRKMSGDARPEAVGDSERSAERAAAGAEDAKLCLASPAAGRLRNPRPERTVAAPPPDADGEPESPPVAAIKKAVVPMPPPRVMPDAPTKDERLGELDSLLFDDGKPERAAPPPPSAETPAAPARPVPDPTLSDPLGVPEELAALERARKREERLRAEAEAARAADRATPKNDLLGRATGEKEAFPAGGPGAGREPGEAPAAVLMPDAGTPAPEKDRVPALMELLSSSDPRRRARAADELGKLGAKAAPAASALRSALKDKRPAVRASAALALGNLGEAGGGAVKELVRALRDKSEDVRASAALSLARLPTKAARAAYTKHVRAEARALIESR